MSRRGGVLASPPVQIPFSLLDPPTARSTSSVSARTASISWRSSATFPRSNTKHRIETFARLPGGQVASAMVCCARLGWRARYVGRFGNDELGQIGLASLEQEGVDVSAAQTVAARTRFAIVLVDHRTGDRTVLWDRDPALAIRPADVAADVWTSARVAARRLRRHRRGNRGREGGARERRADGDRRRGGPAGRAGAPAAHRRHHRVGNVSRTADRATTTPAPRWRRWRASTDRPWRA